jgi:bile acid:Na+ symporter, BASS family
METLKQLLPLILQGSLILVMVAIGLQSRWSDFLFALRRPGWLLRGIVAVNVIPPLVAAVLISILPLSVPAKLGIILMAVAPLAPFAPGKMLKAGASSSGVIGIYSALALLSVIVVPLTVSILSAIFPGDATIAPASIWRLVQTSVLIPLIAGAAIANLLPELAPKLSRLAHMLGTIGLLVFIVPTLIAFARPMLALVGNATIFAIVLTVAAALAGGHWLGGPERANREALADAAATRHPGMAIMIGAANFDDPRVSPAVILFLLVGIAVSTLYSIWLKRSGNAATVSSP